MININVSKRLTLFEFNKARASGLPQLIESKGGKAFIVSLLSYDEVNNLDINAYSGSLVVPCNLLNM